MTMLQSLLEQVLLSFKNFWLGMAVYLLRACLVFGYGAVSAPIGGPNVDESALEWMPFVMADFPWSFLFDNFTYSSNAVALTAYALVVGLP